MSLPSRHRIRNLKPGGLKLRTLPICVSFKPPRPWNEPRTLAWKAALLTTTLGPLRLNQQFVYLLSRSSIRRRGLTLTALKYICINHGEQQIIINVLDTCSSFCIKYLCYGFIVIINISFVQVKVGRSTRDSTGKKRLRRVWWRRNSRKTKTNGIKTVWLSWASRYLGLPLHCQGVQDTTTNCVIELSLKVFKPTTPLSGSTRHNN